MALGSRLYLDDLQLGRDQTRSIDTHPAIRIQPPLFIARWTNRPNVGIGYLGEAADRARGVELGRPEKVSGAAHLVFGDQTVRGSTCPIVQPDGRIVFLMIHHHHALRPRKGIFHRRKPAAQSSELLLGKFVPRWCRVNQRRNTPHRRWKRHDIGLLGHFVPFAPDHLAAS